MIDRTISVVIPTFNREKVLKRAIDSVVSQTYDKWELIIVDDCSSDSSVKISKEYTLIPNIKFILLRLYAVNIENIRIIYPINNTLFQEKKVLELLNISCQINMH
mgnify:CR=1 FL=1